MLITFCQQFGLFKVNLWWLQTQMRNFSCGLKMSRLQWMWVCFGVWFF